MADQNNGNLSPIYLSSISQTLPKFGGANNEQVEPFLEAVDDAKHIFHIGNRDTASMASMNLNGSARTWLQLERIREKLQNLDIWLEEKADPTANPAVLAKTGGLRNALKNQFSQRLSRDQLTKCFGEWKNQPQGLNIQNWRNELERALRELLAVSAPAHLLEEGQKANLEVYIEQEMQQYLWNGMAAPYKDLMLHKKDTLTTADTIIAYAVKLERDPHHGVKLRAYTQANAPVKVAASTSSETGSKPKKAKGQDKKEASKKKDEGVDKSNWRCEYCGKRWTHHQEECDLRKERGDPIGSKHPDYPLKSFKEKKLEWAEKKKAEKAAKEASGQVSGVSEETENVQVSAVSSRSRGPSARELTPQEREEMYRRENYPPLPTRGNFQRPAQGPGTQMGPQAYFTSDEAQRLGARPRVPAPQYSSWAEDTDFPPQLGNEYEQGRHS